MIPVRLTARTENYPRVGSRCIKFIPLMMHPHLIPRFEVHAASLMPTVRR
jgi:hypothetical protein